MSISVPTATQFRRPFSALGNRFGILPNSKYYGPQGHRGQDFHAAEGTLVPSIAAGVVSEIVWTSVLGRVVIVRHNPATGPDLFAFYCHLSKTSVRPGQVLKLGQTLGKVGGKVVNGVHTSGTASSGSHLHLAMSHTPRGGINGTVFDPLAYIDGHDTAVPTAVAGKRRAKYTTARRGEGLSAIGKRTKVSTARMIALNASTVRAPEYLVQLGQRIRYA